MEMQMEDQKLVVSPVSKKGLTLEQLLAEITEENLHEEVDTGPATGKEAW
jgi:antitoxin component of MazEF toxin-antitoxin module